MKAELRGSGSEGAILNRVLEPNKGTFPIAAAKALLKLRFSDQDQKRMHELALLNQEGRLTPGEEIEIDNYRRVGRFIDSMHSKARLSLKKPGISK